MDQQIYDGKCHALTDDLGYIIRIIDPSKSFLEIKMIEMEIIREYARYLFENQKEVCLDIMCQHLSFGRSEEFSIIYRPPWLCGSLAQNAQLAIKFKRIKNDNL